MPRLDLELVRRGLARSRTHAAKLIADGHVAVRGKAAAKASLDVAEDDAIDVESSDHDRYASRAGHKLAGALARFPDIDPRGLRCLDAGASTGGFTDVLLERGAARVAAVDVGHGQLVDRLRDDPRVDVFEGLNVRDLVPESIGGPVQLTVADLSFISLTLVVGPLAGCTVPGGDLLLMVKPQFEVGRERLAKTGVVSSPRERRRAVATVAQAAVDAGVRLRGLAESPLPGQDGNVEYFLWLTRPRADDAHPDGATAIEELLATVWPESTEPAVPIARGEAPR
ncbi:TlyA family RNA methyltransferase [Sinomonas sp. ASV322]|uniref:TlyA family RNA methyltransferase n=1 Tax=Sinomonas sp. ASV322 TaxID=3041920 RepID=UPI0027DEA092|nr:TlyA family RNA methyltransferase [Sinomonas sp. ASV322]MDQ4500695.1 TlyA family RNA methyltransferase [Sinomonas sp. ASV322]